LRSDIIKDLGGLSDGDQVAASLVVKTEVFGEGLADHHFESGVCE
jgi:hypothetical protein